MITIKKTVVNSDGSITIWPDYSQLKTIQLDDFKVENEANLTGLRENTKDFLYYVYEKCGNNSISVKTVFIQKLLKSLHIKSISKSIEIAEKRGIVTIYREYINGKGYIRLLKVNQKVKHKPILKLD